ncbi:MAG: ZIP family metal transporter [Oscillospiraceae bacterium]|nr:ZIP family metal transporter [Oscillospiraceae bacterium]
MEIFIFSAIAGILGMGLGGAVSAILLKRPSDKIMCWTLSFAAGIMTGIVCFSLVPEAIAISHAGIAIAGLIIGIIVIMVLNRIVDRLTKKSTVDLTVHHTHEELYHTNDITQNRTKMLRSGIIMFTAISLHNLPEGIAIGAGGSHDLQFGLLITLMILLHNLPEGMAVSAPLLAGGLNRWKVIFLTALSGAPTLLGGVIGLYIGNISDAAVALSLSIAGGAMLYVVFGEIIPQSIVMTKNRTATIVTLSGIIMGLVLTLIH